MQKTNLQYENGQAQGMLLRMASDEQLMLRYRDGDHAAFDTLYSKYRGDVYRFLLRQFDQATAEELYQDIWLKLINARHNYQASASFRTWLYTITHNHVRDHWRRQKNRTEDQDDTAIAHTADDIDPEIAANDGQVIDALLQGIALLPEEQQQAFLLKNESGLSLDEIAEVMDASKESTKSRLRYAIKKLREHLKGIWP